MSVLILDINECKVGTDNCTQKCENTLGSFKCGCMLGCKLADNMASCEGITIVINYSIMLLNRY